MASEAGELRRGLPRVPGGEPWPPAGTAPQHGAPAAPAVSAAAELAAAAAAPVAGAEHALPSDIAAEHSADLEVPAAPAAPAVPETPAEQRISGPAAGRMLRRGLPRVPGGKPWPPASAASGASETAVPAPAPASVAGAVQAEPVAAPAASAAPSAAVRAQDQERVLRRGLPRIAGGEPWPPAGSAPAAASTAASGIPVAAAGDTSPATDTTAATGATVISAQASAPAQAQAQALPPTQAPVPAPSQPAAPAVSAQQAPAPKQTSAPQAQQAAAPTQAPALKQAPAPQQAQPAVPAEPREPSRVAALASRAGRAALWALAVVAAAGIAVLAARGLTTLPGVPEFMRRYPGEYAPAVQPDEGFPAWARWSHFLNFFFMVLIVRTGLLVRHQQKPPAFFTPKRGGKKVSIYLWLHTSIDLLWLANGVAFVVLLFVSGHWARIVPTSWEVFPNALSAALQYATLEWPAENGWVNYNALQQLMYFAVVFIAAPLAAITGVRMSSWWPERATRLSRAFPAPVARAVHYPVMLFFVLFVVVHVFLVLSTGALRNLNHMFAGTDRVSWAGFAWFAGGLLVTAAVTWAARPLVLAPIAGAFGRVSER